MKKIPKKSISVIIPTYNEAENITQLIIRLHTSLTKAGYTYEIIVVDDHSTDKTRHAVKELAKKLPITLYTKVGSRGKAFSLIEGFQKAKYDNLAFIDADLQYPPEAISKMADMLDTADIVVANRKSYKDNIIRKTMSRTFRLGFGRLLFGINYDIQSGLKVFKKEVVKSLNITPSSQWTFDLEFLYKARHAGFTIASHDITFSKRLKGHSAVNIVKSSLEIGVNALRVKGRGTHPIHSAPTHTNMIGAGVRHKKKQYITHSTLHHKNSAIITFTRAQLAVIVAIVALTIGFLISSPLLTLQVIISILSFVYFADVLFNLYVVIKSIRSTKEITTTPQKIRSLKDSSLPAYTILCPLYKEAHIIPQFMKAIDAISWPKKKLDVMLLLEEDDKDTINATKNMNLPSYVRVVIVPASQPKTKPKACNYGLSLAKGEYLVIYDAEDIPDPLQLKKAYLGFKSVDRSVVCLQAKLNYYNPSQNLLTRFFTAEYSLWFDVTLTGLQTLGTTIPLGGTSNHFRTADLLALQGWDPFNVTEDADLGMRLFKDGYKTGILDSVTLEEANSKVGNWIRQRSRWIKGYMQTYLVHNREVLSFAKKRKQHYPIFHLLIGGKIAFILINPFLWVATLAYFTLYAYVGPTIESLYPAYVFYIAMVSLVFGNFLFFYYYMIALAKREQVSLMKYSLLIPVYWGMISVAGFVALYQLFFKPFYWEKTVHGLHLAPKKTDEKKDAIEEILAPVVTKPAFRLFAIPLIWIGNIETKLFKLLVFVLVLIGKKESTLVSTLLSVTKKAIATPGALASFVTSMPFLKPTKTAFLTNRKLVIEGFILLASANIANVLGYLFNALLGRVLTFEDFAFISLIGSIFTVLAVPAIALSTTVNHKTAYLIGEHGQASGHLYWKSIRRRVVRISLLLTVLWILLSPIISHYFKISEFYAIVIFAPIILTIFIAAADRGFLYGKLMFAAIAGIYVIEPFVKLAFTALAVASNISQIVYIAIPASTLSAFVLGWIIAHRNKTIAKNPTKIDFPMRFFLISVVAGLSTLSFLSIDILLAKHFLSAQDAGKYGLISLAGKMVFFLGGLTAPFITPLVSRRSGENKDTKHVLYLALLGTGLLSAGAFLAFGVLGSITLPVLYGTKAHSIAGYVPLYTFAIFCFTLSQVFVSYYLAKKDYQFALALSGVTILQIVALNIFNSSISDFVWVMAALGVLSLTLAAGMHMFYAQVTTIIINIRDFADLFKPSKHPRNSKGLRILIFNWRDTKHKWAGGAEVYVGELAKRFVKNGNTVTVFCGNDQKNLRNETIHGVKIIRRGGFYTVYMWAALYYIFKFRKNYDIIIDSENGIPFFSPLYSTKPVILLIHHVHQDIFIQHMKFPFSYIGRFIEGRLMPFVYKNKTVITVSKSSMQEIIKVGIAKERNIEIINPGVNIVKTSNQKTSYPSFIYLGRLKPYKNVDIAIAAFARVQRKFTNAKLLIVGEGESITSLRELAVRLKLSEAVTFYGKVSDRKKTKLLAKSWAALQPSQMEGWGITVMEANGCKTPVIASDTNGLRDSIVNGETGLLFKVGNVSQLTAHMVSLATYKSKRTRLSKNSYKWAKKFSWDTSVTQFMTVVGRESTRNRMFSTRNVSYLLNRVTSIF